MIKKLLSICLAAFLSTPAIAYTEEIETFPDYKDIELLSWKDKYEAMMILKSAENDRLYDLVTKTKPGREPFMVALGFGIGTLTSLGIFALSTEIVAP